MYKSGHIFLKRFSIGSVAGIRYSMYMYKPYISGVQYVLFSLPCSFFVVCVALTQQFNSCYFSVEALAKELQNHPRHSLYIQAIPTVQVCTCIYVHLQKRLTLGAGVAIIF